MSGLQREQEDNQDGRPAKPLEAAPADGLPSALIGNRCEETERE